MKQCVHQCGIHLCNLEALDGRELCAFHCESPVSSILLGASLADLVLNRDPNDANKELHQGWNFRVHNPETDSFQGRSFRHFKWFDSHFSDLDLAMIFQDHWFSSCFFQNLRLRDSVVDQFSLERCRIEGLHVNQCSLVNGKIYDLESDLGFDMCFEFSKFLKCLLTKSKFGRVSLMHCRLENFDLLDSHLDILRFDSCDLVNCSLSGLSGRIEMKNCRILGGRVQERSDYLDLKVDNCEFIAAHPGSE